MSSHHIVRDAQEPALIIANGEACSTGLLNELLEWSPVVLVLDGAIDRVLDLGIKVDILLGDFDRKMDPQEILKQQPAVQIIHAPDQDKTDLEKGIEFLQQAGHSAINIVWATGKRADHAISNMTNIIRYKNELTIVVYDDYSKIFCLPLHFTKWYVQGATLSLIPVGTVNGITTTGLKYDLLNEELRMGYRSGNSNEAANDGVVTITHTEGDLLLMECHD